MPNWVYGSSLTSSSLEKNSTAASAINKLSAPPANAIRTPSTSSLATDLATHEPFHCWLLDLVSPGLLKLMQKKMEKAFDKAAAPFSFAPAEGPEFFSKFGWKPAGVRSMFHAAGKLKRLPPIMSFFYHLQKSDDFQAKRPWAGACVLERK